MLSNYQNKSKVNMTISSQANLFAQQFKDDDLINFKLDTVSQDKISQAKKRTRIPFTKEEDERLIALVNMFGIKDKNNWYFIANNIIGRSPRQCRERYQLFLSDQIRKKAKWTKEEDELLISKYKLYGPHWKKMEQFFEGRTSYNIKNRFISLNRRFKFQFQAEQNQIMSPILSSPIAGEENDKTSFFDIDNHFMSNEMDFDSSFEELSYFDDENNFIVF